MSGVFPNPKGTDPAGQALLRLEAAVERLAAAAARPRPEGGIPREVVLQMAERLDLTIARLREALGHEGLDGVPGAAEEE